MENTKGYKTVSRTRITEFLKNNADRSVTVNDIECYLSEEKLDINTSTVYRCLNKLTSEGIINKYVANKGEMALFQYAGASRDCSGHLHMQCTDCGRVIHLDCGFMDEIKSHVYEEHGFEILCKGSILYGLCKACSERRE